MRRRISLLLAAVLAGTTLMLLGPAQPASALEVCAGQGTAAVTPGLLYPVLFGVLGPMKDHLIDVLIGKPNTIHGFSITLAPGCVHPPSTTPTPSTATGTLKGYCGHSVGTGTLDGQAFSYVSFGTFLIITGHVVGAVSAIPAPGTGSCLHFDTPLPTPGSLPSGAGSFIVTGAAVKLNCANALPSASTLVDVPQQLVLVVEPVTGLSVLGIHVELHPHVYATTPCVPNLL